MSGGLFTINKEWFRQLGFYDVGKFLWLIKVKFNLSWLKLTWRLLRICLESRHLQRWLTVTLRQEEFCSTLFDDVWSLDECLIWCGLHFLICLLSSRPCQSFCYLLYVSSVLPQKSFQIYWKNYDKTISWLETFIQNSSLNTLYDKSFNKKVT